MQPTSTSTRPHRGSRAGPTPASPTPAGPTPAGPTPAGPTPAGPTRDSQRAKVYRAEDAWAARLDAARRGAPLASVAGSAVVLPAERRFGDLDHVVGYLDRVLALPDVVAAFGVVPPPWLRLRRGAKAAHWESPGTIAVPVPQHGEPWALRETVVLHELAHHIGHVTGRADRHAAPFPAVLLVLVAAVLGEEAAFVLRVDYGSARVEVGAL